MINYYNNLRYWVPTYSTFINLHRTRVLNPIHSFQSLLEIQCQLNIKHFNFFIRFLVICCKILIINSIHKLILLYYSITDTALNKIVYNILPIIVYYVRYTTVNVVDFLLLNILFPSSIRKVYALILLRSTHFFLVRSLLC